MPALPKGFLQMLQAKEAAAKAGSPGGANNPTPGQIPQSVAPAVAANNASNPLLRTPTYLTVGGQPINAAPQPSPVQQLAQLSAAYNKNPYAGLSGQSRASSSPSDPAWWLTYGMGPEASFFANNETPQATPTGAPPPGPASGTPAPGTGPVSPRPVPNIPQPISGALHSALWRSPLLPGLNSGALAQLAKLGYTQPSQTPRNQTIQPIMGSRT